ncbi:MAG: hypothetical protein HN742_00305 [Lentisphaerae bacterium]|nr:hypothetical protein [Lentisphaerota bacterium]MBT4815137.1 hypothetical protein [Lentisphaerota bacterium]MBT5608785.1 hypothetical protein [Lentisphaerota bacterium]MBT7058296.1 hypothetical protein [Lentisphaerota bacterium]MBT7840271.1 hypothetical protein [Lentisphaerota bacterium]
MGDTFLGHHIAMLPERWIYGGVFVENRHTAKHERLVGRGNSDPKWLAFIPLFYQALHGRPTGKAGQTSISNTSLMSQETRRITGFWSTVPGDVATTYREGALQDSPTEERGRSGARSTVAI